MIIEKVLIKYMNAVTSDVFVRYEKELDQRRYCCGIHY